jgi:hypothetical protein
MEYSQNKINSLRRLLLGSLHDKCKSGGVTREELQAQLERVKQNGQCLEDCSVDDLINVCEMKSRTLPACYSSNEEKERPCMDRYREDEFKNRFQLYDEPNGQAVQANWIQYTRSAKLMEDWPDSDEEDEEEDEMKEREECMYCWVDQEDEQGNKQEIIKLPCGHTVHPNCIIKSVVSTGKTSCPACRRPIPNEYTGNIRMILQGKWKNYINTVNAANPELEPITQESLPFESWLHFEAIDDHAAQTMATAEEKVLYRAFLSTPEAAQIAEQQVTRDERTMLVNQQRIRLNQAINSQLQSYIDHMREDLGWILPYYQYEDISAFINELFDVSLINEATKNFMINVVNLPVLTLQKIEDVKSFILAQKQEILSNNVNVNAPQPSNYVALYFLVSFLVYKNNLVYKNIEDENVATLMELQQNLSRQFFDETNQPKIFCTLIRQTYDPEYLQIVTKMFTFMITYDFTLLDLEDDSMLFCHVIYSTMWRYITNSILYESDMIPVVLCFIRATFITIWGSSILQKFKVWCTVIHLLVSFYFTEDLIVSDTSIEDLRRIYKFLNITVNLMTFYSTYHALQFLSQNNIGYRPLSDELERLLASSPVTRRIIAFTDDRQRTILLNIYRLFEPQRFEPLPEVNAWRDQYLQAHNIVQPSVTFSLQNMFTRELDREVSASESNRGSLSIGSVGSSVGSVSESIGGSIPLSIGGSNDFDRNLRIFSPQNISPSFSNSPEVSIVDNIIPRSPSRSPTF